MTFWENLFSKKKKLDVKYKDDVGYIEEKLGEEDCVRKREIKKKEKAIIQTDTANLDMVQSKEKQQEWEQKKIQEVDEMNYTLSQEELDKQEVTLQLQRRVQECQMQCKELQVVTTDQYKKDQWSCIENWLEVITIFNTEYKEAYLECEEMLRGIRAKIAVQQNKWLEVDEEINQFRVQESILKADIEKFGQTIKILNKKLGNSTNWGGKKPEFVKYRKELEVRRETYLKEELELNNKLKQFTKDHNAILKLVSFYWIYLLSVLEGITL